MRITVQPLGAKSIPLTVTDGTTLGQAVDKSGVDITDKFTYQLNGQDADRAERLREGDIVGVFPPVKGQVL